MPYILNTEVYCYYIFSGNFSFVLQSEDVSNVTEASTSGITTVRARKDTKKSKTQKSRGTSTLHFCEKCSKEFGSKTLFVRHLRSHTGLFFCR